MQSVLNPQGLGLFLIVCHWRLESTVLGPEKLLCEVIATGGTNRAFVRGERRNKLVGISDGRNLVSEWMPDTEGCQVVSKYLIPLFTTTITGSQEISGQSYQVDFAEFTIQEPHP